MAGLRPPLLDAALRSCTRATRSPGFRNALLQNTRSETVQRRWISDGGGRGPLPQGSPQKITVVAPKTRLVVGVVFISALIYSMVQLVDYKFPACVH
jgi:coproporphyrinogen III oxidase